MKKILLLLSLSLLLGYAHAQIRYVKPTATGAGDGTSWADASGDIQAMIDAGAGTVYVAAGVYTPTKVHHENADDLDPRNQSFVLAANVKVYGGFSGTDDNEGLDDRNFVLNETILDGDLLGNDIADPNDPGYAASKADNAYHVVFSLTTAGIALDGFTIRNGFADNGTTVPAGGSSTAVYARDDAGGIYLRGTGSLELKNLVFHSNRAIGGSGGVGYIRPSGTSAVWTLTNITMYNNEASLSAGGMYVYSATSGRPTVKVDRMRAYNNKCANIGGALYFNGYSTSTGLRGEVRNSIFYNNQSTTSTTATGAAAIGFGTFTDMSLINNTFYNNQSRAQCGAVSHANSTDVILKLYNNLFAKNLGGSPGVAYDMRGVAASVLDVQNNIFQKLPFTAGSDDTYENNIIETNTSSLFLSEDENDPNFLNIKEGPATNSGLNDYYTIGDKDFLGEERQVHGTVDIGAFEYQGTLPVTIGSFTANLVNNRTQLKWSVGTENNVNRYEVKRSQNGTDFIKVAEITANGSVSYSAIDNNPQLGVNYYRLVAVDNDGTRHIYEQIQSVKVASLSAESAQVYPNPVKGNVINIALNGYASGNYSYKLVNTTGAVLGQGSVNYDGRGLVSINTDASAGVYVLYLANGSSPIKIKLVKQ